MIVYLLHPYGDYYYVYGMGVSKNVCQLKCRRRLVYIVVLDSPQK